jgi:predicted lipoprotein
MRLLAAAAFALLSAPALGQGAVPFHDMIRGAVDDFARPKFAAFAATTAKLRTDVAALCAAPGEATLAAAQQSFKDVVIAYSTIEFVRMGPLNVDERVERLLFWPDTKGIALKQVQAAIGTKDAAAARPETLQKKSVAMQGLGAVEFILFGTGSDDLKNDAGSYRCSYGAAAATLIDGVAEAMSREWSAAAPDGPVDAMLNPRSTSPDFRTELEVVNKLAAVLTLGTDTIRDQRLSPILSLSTGAPKPRLALFWRSGMTVPSIKANFAGLRDFFRAAGFEAALAGKSQWIADGVEFEVKSALEAAAEVSGPIDKAVADPAGLQGLKQMYVSTGSLDTLLGDNTGTALGLSVGFSSLDGD